MLVLSPQIFAMLTTRRYVPVRREQGLIDLIPFLAFSPLTLGFKASQLYPHLLINSCADKICGDARSFPVLVSSEQLVRLKEFSTSVALVYLVVLVQMVCP
jgi:hypothetical protein